MSAECSTVLLQIDSWGDGWTFPSGTLSIIDSSTNTVIEVITLPSGPSASQNIDLVAGEYDISWTKFSLLFHE